MRATILSVYKRGHFLLARVHGGGHYRVEEEHILYAVFVNEIFKSARGVVAVIDHVDLIVGVNKEGDERVTEGFLDYDNG